jgi:hypothetical protein
MKARCLRCAAVAPGMLRQTVPRADVEVWRRIKFVPLLGVEWLSYPELFLSFTEFYKTKIKHGFLMCVCFLRRLRLSDRDVSGL